MRTYETIDTRDIKRRILEREKTELLAELISLNNETYSKVCQTLHSDNPAKLIRVANQHRFNRLDSVIRHIANL